MRARDRVSTTRTLVVRALVAGALVASVACSAIIGADKDRRVAAGGPSQDASADGGGPSPIPTGSRAPCGPGEKRCDGICVRADDPVYGCHPTECMPRCSVPFAVIVKCQNDACAAAQCLSDRGDCNGNRVDGCEADLRQPEACGSCAESCPTSAPYCADDVKRGCVTSCPSGTTKCGSACVDLTTDPGHCGSCTIACPSSQNADPTCALSACGLACREGFAQCDVSASGCEPKRPYFADQDRDGFGAGQRLGESCELPASGLSFSGADCKDDDPNVSPGQRSYFGAPYPSATGPASYDYDCNGVEEGAPGAAPEACSASFKCH